LAKWTGRIFSKTEKIEQTSQAKILALEFSSKEIASKPSADDAEIFEKLTVAKRAGAMV